jgi:hypothetical protein
MISGRIGTVTISVITPVAVAIPIVSTITAIVVAIVTTVIASVSITTIAPMVVSIVVIASGCLQRKMDFTIIKKRHDLLVMKLPRK